MKVKNKNAIALAAGLAFQKDKDRAVDEAQNTSSHELNPKSQDVGSANIEILVLSIATNQFTVPLPSGKDVIQAINSHAALYSAAKAALAKLESLYLWWYGPCDEITELRAALALVEGNDNGK